MCRSIIRTPKLSLQGLVKITRTHAVYEENGGGICVKRMKVFLFLLNMMCNISNCCGRTVSKSRNRGTSTRDWPQVAGSSNGSRVLKTNCRRKQIGRNADRCRFTFLNQRFPTIIFTCVLPKLNILLSLKLFSLNCF